MYSFLFITLLLIFSTSEGSSQEKALTKRFLEDYVASARPVKNDSKAVEVSLGVTLHSITEIDKNSLSGIFWLNMEWVDENLAWRGGDWDDVFEKVGDIRLRTKDIWVPDIELFNMIEREPQITRDMVVVSDTGAVTWVPPYKMISSCKIDTTWFPFDEQRCDLKFGSWVYNGFNLNLEMKVMDGMDISSYVTNPEWDLIGTSGTRNEVIYDCCPEPYLDITYNIHVRRRTIPYLRNIIMPSFTITLVSILTLLIPATNPSPRFLTIFLLFILFCITIPKDFPQASLLSSLLSWCYFTLFCSLIHSVIVTAIVNPLFLQSLSFDNKVIRAILLKTCCGGMEKSKEGSEEQVRYELAKTLDTLAILLFLVVFLFGFGGTLLSAPYLFVQ